MKKLLFLFVLAVSLFIFTGAEASDSRGLSAEQIKELESVAHILSSKTEKDWMKIELVVITERAGNEVMRLAKKGVTKEELGILKLNYLIFSEEIKKCLQDFSENCFSEIKEFSPK